MMKIKILTLLIAMMFAWMPSYGSDVFDVKIKRVHIYKEPAPSGGVFVTFSGSPKTNNPCPGGSQEYFIDLNDQPRGSLLYAQAVAAFQDDAWVNIYGTGLCGGHASVETISDFQMFKD